MNPKPRHLILIFAAVILAWGLLEPTALRAAVANNLWSLRFIRQAYPDRLPTAELAPPPATHLRAGMLLAHQALKAEDLNLAVTYLAPLYTSSDRLVIDTYADVLFLQGNIPEAVEIWKELGKWFTLEQAYRVLEGDDLILALEAAYELRPETYARSLINAKLTRAKTLLEEAQYPQAVAAYQEVITRFPSDGKAYSGLAQAYWQNGQQEQALAAIEEGWELNAENARYFIDAARLYEEMGLADRALDAYRVALTIEPGNTAALEGIERLSAPDD